MVTKICSVMLSSSLRRINLAKIFKVNRVRTHSLSPEANDYEMKYFLSSLCFGTQSCCTNCNEIRSLVNRIAFDGLVKILSETGIMFSK